MTVLRERQSNWQLPRQGSVCGAERTWKANGIAIPATRQMTAKGAYSRTERYAATLFPSGIVVSTRLACKRVRSNAP